MFVSSAAGLHNAFATPSTIIYIYTYIKRECWREREREGKRDIVKCMRRRLLRRTNEINVCVCVPRKVGIKRGKRKTKSWPKKQEKKLFYFYLGAASSHAAPYSSTGDRCAALAPPTC